MNPSEDKFTEKDLEDLTKSFGKPLPKGFEEGVFAKIRQKQRLKNLESLNKENSNPDRELEK